jgi:hypothetical protein
MMSKVPWLFRLQTRSLYVFFPPSYYIKAPALVFSYKTFFPIGVVISFDSFYYSTGICYSQLLCTFITFMTRHSACCNLSYENHYWRLYSYRLFFLWHTTKSDRILQNFSETCRNFPTMRDLLFRKPMVHFKSIIKLAFHKYSKYNQNNAFYPLLSSAYVLILP